MTQGVLNEPPLRNPEAERNLYSTVTDDSMTVLRFEAEDGAELGTINWFAVHGTSPLDNENRLISGDNKGYAAYRFEQLKLRQSASPFVAAFAQSNEGDNSPNVYGDDRNGRGQDPFASMEHSGTRQFEAALVLYEEAIEVLPAVVRVRHAYVDMSSFAIEPARAGGLVSVRTKSASVGASALAGTEDGRGVGWEGLSKSAVLECLQRSVMAVKLFLAVKPWRIKDLASWWRLLVRTSVESDDQKIEVIPTGRLRPPWTPQVLPMQLAQIGSLAVIAMPFELTTMAGRRLKKEVLTKLTSEGVTRVVIVGLANAYAGYVATREEYGSQHYEGASTPFGPWTLTALKQEFETLAKAIATGVKPPSSGEPAPPSDVLIDAQTSVLMDAAPPGRSLGRLRKDAQASYGRGGKVVVSCWAGHPKNDLPTEGTFISVQRREGETWVEVAADHHPATRFIWRRWLFPWLPFSTATAEWRIPQDAGSGVHRICILGEGKGLFGSARSYLGQSSEFTLR